MSMKGKVDRRTFLKMMGGAGATAAFISTVPPAFGQRLAANQLAPLAQVGSKGADVLLALPKDKLLQMYSRMLAARKWETKMKDLFVGGVDGIYGAFHVYIGEEGIAVGAMAALNDDDYIASTHRGHGHLIAKGGSLDGMSAEIYFRQTGLNKGFGGSMHITDMKLGILGMNGIVGAGWYISAGAAYGIMVRKTKQVAMALAGEGSTNSPYFFSALRNAALYRLPFIAVVENNQYHISTPYRDSCPVQNVADYVAGLPIARAVVDGNDVAEVYAAAKDAVDRARAGGGPSIIEAKTYRWYDHYGFAGAKVGVDGAWGLPYRSDAEVRAWMAKDPLPRFKALLSDNKVVAESDFAKVEKDVTDAVEASVEFARKSLPPDTKAGLTNVYAAGAVAATQFLTA